ncbi:MAG TPA: right-handed parallel beta-helix repeat-containing protein [Usitatibacter sp.]|nr:right-handed parallel beta-helix repeat-containing protein [Usitatibacter sp.]
MRRHAIQASRVRTLAASLSVLLVGTALYASNVRAQTPAATLPSTGTIAITTYESAGLYWQSPGGTAGCEVKYRKNGETSWKQALPMWYDARDGQCRGSIVGLEAGTWYQAELNIPGQAASRGLVFQTWSNAKPVAKTIAVNGGSAQYTITEGGSPSGWVVYEGNGATLDGGNSATYNIHVKASYVIIRGLNLKGARQDAIRLEPTVHDVVIEDNDISGWGRTRDGGTWATNMDSGVRGYCSETSSGALMRVTIQRNKIHDPRYGANSWSDGHPAGAQAVSFSHCGGQLVIRHNEIYSTTGKYFNDGIGGEDNFTKAGFPNADSDIYGNRISHAWDDGIEAEGANENVRIWGNYIDRTAIGIATTATSVGPVYIYRNVWNRAQMYEKSALDSDDRQPFFKSGGTTTLGHGRRYIMHNTMLQARASGSTYGLGGGYGLGGTGSTQLIENTYSYNNIYHQWKDGKGFTYQTGSTSKFTNDMYNGTTGDTTVANGIKATPQYASGHGWQSEAGGNYQLASGTPGFGAGVKIPNFNDDATAPDVGAHQSGTPSMKFGLAGSPGNSITGTGTTPTTPSTPTDPVPTTPTTPTAPAGTGVTPSASTLYFNASTTQTVTYTNNTGATVQFLQASINSGRYQQSNNCDAVAPGASCRATVTYYGSNSGSDTATFTMTSNAPNSPHLVALTRSAPPASAPSSTGTGVTLSASTLDFRNGANATRTVTYTNNTGSTVQFLQASISSGKFQQKNDCDAVAPGRSCTATVTWYRTNSGSDTATFTMTSSAPNSPHLVTLKASSSKPYVVSN